MGGKSEMYLKIVAQLLQCTKEYSILSAHYIQNNNNNNKINSINGAIGVHGGTQQTQTSVRHANI